MTVTQAAAALGIDVATVRRHIERGLMRAEKINPRLYLIPDEEIEAWKNRPDPRLKRGPKPKAIEG